MASQVDKLITDLKAERRLSGEATSRLARPQAARHRRPARARRADGKRPPGRIGWLLLRRCWCGRSFVVAPTAILFVYSFAQRGTLGGVVYDFTFENFARLGDRSTCRS